MSRKVAVVLVSLVCLMAVALFLGRTSPVVYAFREAGEPNGEPAWVLMNPFRDRRPEQAAESVLRRLRTGHSSVALQSVRGLSAETLRYLEAREKAHPLTGWRLVDWKEDRTRVRLAYRTSRGETESADSPVWITVQELGGVWKAVEFEAWY